MKIKVIIDYDAVAQQLAGDLFELGSEPEHPVTRIEFKSGPAVASEIPLGGLSKPALRQFLARKLEQMFDISTSNM